MLLDSVAQTVGGGLAQAGRAAESFAGDLLGLRGIVGKVTDPILKIREFADRQIDALLNGAVSATRNTVEFVEHTLQRAMSEVSPLDGAIEVADLTLAEVKQIPHSAMRLIDEGQTIRRVAEGQHAAIKKRIADVKRARLMLPPEVYEHFEEISLEVEEGLEVEAAEALRFGEEAELETQQLYEKTVSDAQRYSGILLQQTEDNRQRVVHLRQGIRGGIDSIKIWAGEQVQRAGRFRSERVAKAGSIASPIDAERWATESITGAQQLAGEIGSELARKPGEAATYGRARVEEAMRLAKGLKQQVDTAHAWAITQRGNQSKWKAGMRDIRVKAQSRLEGQTVRVEMRVEEHAAAILNTGKKLATAEVKRRVPGVEETIVEVEKAVAGERQDILKPPTLRDLPDIEVDFSPDIAPPELPEITFDESSGMTAPDLQHRESPKKSTLQVEVGQKPHGAKPSVQPPTKPKPEPQPAQATKKPPSKEIQETAHRFTMGSMAEPTPTQPSGKPSRSSLSVQIDQQVVPPQLKKPEPQAAVAFPTASNVATQAEKPAQPKVHSKTNTGKSPPMIAPKKEMPKLAGTQNPSASSPVAKGAPAASPKGSALPPAEKPFSKGSDPKKFQDAVQAPSEKSMPKLAGPGAAKAPTAPIANIQRKASTASPEPQMDPRGFQDRLLQAGGQGEAPDPSVRTEIGRHVGFDPTMVRFHTGQPAQAAARSMHADAFTIGRNVFFASGKFDPRSAKGLGLIGHEITHVGQQLGLKGSKLQLATKTGGDAMEQEAQEMGERIASNLSYRDNLRIGNYVRSYEPADDEPITAGLSARLDRISIAALSRAGRILAGRSRQQPLRLDEVVVDISLDMETLSDAEAVGIWAEAIVAAVESAHPTSPNAPTAKEMSAPSTHILQRALRDLTVEPSALPVPQMDEELLERIAKISPSQAEIKMIQQLLVRPEAERMLSARDDTMSDQTPKIERKLQEHGIESIAAYRQLEKEFIKAFQEKGVNVTSYLLDESYRTIQEQRKKYESTESLLSLISSAQYVLTASREFIDAVGSYGNQHYWQLMHDRGKPNTGNIDSFTDSIWAKGLGSLFEEPSIDKAYKRYMKIRLSEGERHPVLLGRDFDPRSITTAKSMGSAQKGIFEHFSEVEEDISIAKGRMSGDKFWELPEMIKLTRNQMGVRDEDGANDAIKEFQTERAEDKFLWEMIKAGAAVALAVTAMVATGGLAAVAMAGSAGLSIFTAAQSYDNYMFKSAATNAAIDQANLICKDEPSLLWLAWDLISAGMDTVSAGLAFAKLAKPALAAMKDPAVIKEMESVARDAYKTIPEPRLSEDEFVSRLMDTARKGVAHAGDEVAVFAGQARVLTEIMQGTSARVVKALKGDEDAIQELVLEHGNWRGLMGGLQNGGPQAELVAEQMSDWRKRIVQGLKKKGGDTLEGASDELASDMDVNFATGRVYWADEYVIKPMQSGRLLVEIEADMIAKFGSNWESALNMHFYTEASRLLAIDDVLEMVPQARRAEILERATEKSELLNFAKMLDHAGTDNFAREQVILMMEQVGLKGKLAEAEKLAKLVKIEGKDAILKDVDRLMEEMKALPANSPKRVKLAERITERQMEANFLLKEAYISPGALKAGSLNNAEAYQSALAQLEMIQHVVKEAGGDIVRACREYELFKYISRYVEATRAAGLKSPTLTYFESLSTYIYKQARSHHMETGHLVAGMDQGFDRAITPHYLFETYGDFMDEVMTTLPVMRKNAAKVPTEVAVPALPAVKKPGAAAKKSEVSAPMDLSLDPSDLHKGVKTIWDSKSVAGKTGAMGYKAVRGPKEPALEPVKSAGFKDGRSGEGFGMFKGRIPGVSGEVWITVHPESEKYLFDRDLSAAVAAAKTGYGPTVRGKVNLGEGKLAFATDTVSGGFADDYNGELHTLGSERAKHNRKEMLGNAKNITPQTFADVDDYRDKIWAAGFRYWHTPQGFVSPEGRWRPVDFSGASPILESDEEMQALLREMHNKRFDELKGRLMQYHLEAKVAPPKAP